MRSGCVTTGSATIGGFSTRMLFLLSAIAFHFASDARRARTFAIVSVRFASASSLLYSRTSNDCHCGERER